MKKTILLITTISILFPSCSEKKEEKKEEVIPKVSVKSVAHITENEMLHYSGTIEADNIVSLGFSVPGRVSSVLVQEGQRVKKGELLATIEGTSYQNAFDIANASLEQANDNFNRLNALYEKGSLPERDFIAIKVGVAQAKANRNLAEKNVNDTKLYAPFSGTITSKMTEVGATAAPGIPAFTVMKTDNVFAKAAITESEISKLEIGKEALVDISSIKETVKGEVAIINHSADAVSRTFNVKIRLNNEAHKILPGMLSTINIATGNTQSLITIPSEAVLRDPNDILYAFILEGNKAKKNRISLGDFKGKEVVVTGGLKDGDKVIIAGHRDLVDGQMVTL